MRFWRWYSVILGALAMWMAYPPINIGWFAVLGVALILAGLVHASLRQAFLLGFVASTLFFLMLLKWLTIVGLDAWVLLSLVCSVWFGLMGVGVALVSRTRVWPVIVPGLWIAQEWIRGTWPFGGFPWGTLAFSQVETSVGRASTIVGMLGTSGWVVLCASVAVLAIQRWIASERSKAIQCGVAFFILLTIPLAIPVPHVGDNVGGAASAPMAIVQGGTPAIGMNAFDVRRAVLDNHVRESMKLATAIDHGDATKPEFVLWPENASDLDPYRDQAAAAAIGVSARALGVPILVGAVVRNSQDPSTVLNAGILWDPSRGAVQEYDKKHPVPFGEYIPFRAQLAPLIDRFDRIGHDFAAGTKSGIFNVGDIKSGNVICFEVAYNYVTDSLLDEGARVVTVQTNNATYAGTSQPTQQFMIERMRALQMGRSVVVAATTGISAVIGPDGGVQASIGEGQTGSLVRSVALRGERNLGSYLGPFIVFLWRVGALIAVLVLTARALWAWRMRRNKVAQ